MTASTQGISFWRWFTALIVRLTSVRPTEPSQEPTYGTATLPVPSIRLSASPFFVSFGTLASLTHQATVSSCTHPQPTRFTFAHFSFRVATLIVE